MFVDHEAFFVQPNPSYEGTDEIIWTSEGGRNSTLGKSTW
jgi:hypothetical protein